MKNRHFQIVALFTTALSLIFALFTLLFDTNRFDTDSIFIFCAISICFIITFLMYVLLIAKRVNPKQYIYISYSAADHSIATTVTVTLYEQLNKLSKYHFEILSANSVPFGSDIYRTTREYIDKANIVIAVISPEYIHSEQCQQEFIHFSTLNKKIIPIVIGSHQLLSDLPQDISNIKALSLQSCSSEDEFKRQLTILAKELVKNRKN